MADLYGTTVAANARKVPGTDRLGSVGIRELSFFNIALANVHVNYTNANSLFAKCVLGVETGAELFFVGTPSAGNVIVAVATDTVDDSGNADASPTVAEQIKANVDAYTGATATVTAISVVGNAFA